ncbi:MAG: glycosyltransferase family 2 protein [Acidobacteriota bacterium]
MPQAHPRTNRECSPARLETLSVVLPCYNEEKLIRDVVTSIILFLPQAAETFEIIAVDDGSKDRTGKILDELSAQFPSLAVIHHPVNRGYGSALRTGFSRARYKHVFYTDSDGQFDISEILTLIPHVEKADIVTGYRRNRQDPLHRKINSRAFGAFARLTLGLRLRDIDCAFKIYHRKVLDSLVLLSDGILIDTEIFYKAKRQGFTVREVPVTHRARSEGSPTGNRLDVVFRVFRELPKLRRNHS